MSNIHEEAAAEAPIVLLLSNLSPGLWEYASFVAFSMCKSSWLPKALAPDSLVRFFSLTDIPIRSGPCDPLVGGLVCIYFGMIFGLFSELNPDLSPSIVKIQLFSEQLLFNDNKASDIRVQLGINLQDAD
jgi:hypothetical protein